jgi:hypothetical protein
MVEINETVARKVLDTIDAGLSGGLGKPVPGQMCVEAAVCYALGLPHGDDPQCVSQALRQLKIRLNDSMWSSDTARAKGLRRLGLIQLGSAGNLDEQEFSKRTTLLAVNTSVPDALRAAAKLNPAKAERLIYHAVQCAAVTDFKDAAARAAQAAQAAHAAAHAAYAVAQAAPAAEAAEAAEAVAHAAAAAAHYAAYAAYAVAQAAPAAEAAEAVAYAAEAAHAAARAAPAAEAADAAEAAEAADAADESLGKFAEGVVQILISMQVPGVQWLALTEEPK